jgi:two-component system sensor kinase FixL
LSTPTHSVELKHRRDGRGRRTRDLFIAAVDSLPAHVAIVDGTGSIVAVNAAWRRFAASNGMADSSFGVGSNYLTVCDAANGDCRSTARRVGEGIRRVLAGEQHEFREEYDCSSPAHDRWFQVRVTGFVAELRPEAERLAVIVHENITETKRAGRAENAVLDDLAHTLRLATMGELTATVAHELNQPLAAISNFARGCLRMIRSGQAAPGDVERALENAAAEADRAAEVVRRVRGFVRKGTAERSLQDLREVLREILPVAEVMGRRSSCVVDFSTDDAPVPVEVDPVQMQQVAINLIRNAMDAMAEIPIDQRRVAVTVGMRDGAPMFTVRDRGRGIEPGASARLFEPFFTTKRDGLGLGLSICRTIAESHGGRILTVPHVGPGASFRVEFPLY